MPDSSEMFRQYALRRRLQWLLPPAPVWHNPAETQVNAPIGRWNLYIGSAGTHAPCYVNLDLFPLPGVDVAANAESRPFHNDQFQRVECDAVLEHAEFPEKIVREIERVLAPGGYAHLVVPFCHPFHAYPKDYRRYTPDGLRQLAGGLEVVAEGWRTGPTATLLVTILEYAKLWMPNKLLRGAVHITLGWLLFPLRYLDAILLKSPTPRSSATTTTSGSAKISVNDHLFALILRSRCPPFSKETSPPALPKLVSTTIYFY